MIQLFWHEQYNSVAFCVLLTTHASATAVSSCWCRSNQMLSVIDCCVGDVCLPSTQHPAKRLELLLAVECGHCLPKAYLWKTAADCFVSLTCNPASTALQPINQSAFPVFSTHQGNQQAVTRKTKYTKP